MAKRLTASDKWNDPWFCGLSILDKLAWLYFLDTCNHAGIWKANWRLLSFLLGQDYCYDSNVFANRIFEITPEKFFIPKFIEFQYGTLNPQSVVHASVINILTKEGVWKGYAKGRYTLSQPLANPRLTPKDKDKAKDKVKDVSSKTAVKDQEGFGFEAVWSRYPKKLGRKEAERHFKASVKTPQDYLDLQNALDHYVAEIRQNHIEPPFVKHGSTWFNNWRDWINYGGVQMPKPPAPPPRPVEAPPPDLSDDDLRDMHSQKVAQLGPCRDPDCRFCKAEVGP